MRDQFLSLMAVGDAAGMKYEFVDHDIPVSSADIFYGPHPRFAEYQSAHYTDDTQMSVANAEVLLQKDPLEIQPNDFIQSWLDVFKKDPRLGYSKYMYAVMSESQSPADFTSRINPSRGVTSGGAMRAAPFGLLPSINDVKALTILQASLTHNTKAGITSALAVGLATHFFHYHGRKEKLEPFLDRHLGANWLSAENGYDEDPNNGLKIISHAINAIKQSSTLSQVLVNGMSQARIADTDTICAVAMAIASRCDQFKNDLDPMLGKTLENGPYGSDFLKRLDGQLLQKFPGFDQYRSFDLNPGREFKYVPG